ncbi:carbohydrate ABC transporter permease [Flaviflexus huanghaiensis]|uniref:carbohydrate ABC transporter permease n=1 Tax=Flaviflexus huanghaiensis TaxID=1111473 RepID=UPI0015F9A76C|nr:sugar ABC transporter permease [Flaviflexus huanghaiensis]
MSATPTSRRAPALRPSGTNPHEVRAGRGAQRSAQRTYVLMLLPALLLLIGIMIPFADGVWTSLTDEKSYTGSPNFVGLSNYIEMLSNPSFLASLGRTVFYAAAVLAIQLPLSIAVAVLLSRSSFGSWIGRRTLVLPLLIPPIVAGLMWKTMMQPSSGVLNWMLGWFGVDPFPWLTDTSTALMSVILIDTWVFTPFSALIVLAGLQSLPTELHEAAKVDGASAWNMFRHVSLPWIAPYVVLVSIFRVADSLKQFDLIWPVTRGGPLDSTRLLHVLGYEEAFRFSSPSAAMTIIFILWIVVYVVSFLLLRLWRRTVNAVG